MYFQNKNLDNANNTQSEYETEQAESVCKINNVNTQLTFNFKLSVATGTTKHEDVIKRLQFNMQFNMKQAVQAIQHIHFLFENFNVKELCAI